MPDGFSVQPTQLRGSGGDMATAGTGLDGQGELSGDPSIWGSDEEGAAFGGAYAEVAAAAQQAMSALVGEFSSVGERLTTMADSYTGIDQNTTATMRSFEGEL